MLVFVKWVKRLKKKRRGWSEVLYRSFPNFEAARVWVNSQKGAVGADGAALHNLDPLLRRAKLRVVPVEFLDRVVEDGTAEFPSLATEAQQYLNDPPPSEPRQTWAVTLQDIDAPST